MKVEDENPMIVYVSGDIAIENPTVEVREWLDEFLVFPNPTYANLMKRGQQRVIELRHVPEKVRIYSVRRSVYHVPFGCLYPLWPMIRCSDYHTNFAPMEKTAFGGMPCNISLYPYQQQAVNAMEKAKGGVLKSACGSGKTIMGIELLRRLGVRFLWLCGKKDLLEQTYKDFKDLYPEIDLGKTTDGQTEFGKDGTISTVQTMVNVDYRLYENEFGAVLVDEVQNLCADPSTMRQYAKVLSRCNARYKYGVSATPRRSDGMTRAIFAYIGSNPDGTLRPTYEVKDSETNSLVSTYIDLPVDTPDSFAYLEADGTYNYSKLIDYLADRYDRNTEIANAAAEYVKQGRKIAILTLRVAHAEKLNDMLKERGVNSAVVTGGSTKKERDSTIRTPDNWDVIVSTLSLFKEGIDIKALDTVMLVMPVKDRNGIVQAKGRAERPMEGKQNPIFVFVYDRKIPYCMGARTIVRRLVERRS